MTKGQLALIEARKQKRHIELLIAEELQNFHDETGLIVIELEVNRIDVTEIDDISRRDKYQVRACIEIG